MSFCVLNDYCLAACGSFQLSSCAIDEPLELGLTMTVTRSVGPRSSRAVRPVVWVQLERRTRVVDDFLVAAGTSSAAATGEALEPPSGEHC